MAQGQEVRGPGPAIVDRFHPDARSADGGRNTAIPAYGGSFAIHLGNKPSNINRVIENSSASQWMCYAVHDYLLHQDWEHWNLEPRLAESWKIEDALHLTSEAAAKFGDQVVVFKTRGEDADPARVLYGEVTSVEGGYRVTPRSESSSLAGELLVASEDVLSVERGTVFTFDLRSGVPWHDGHIFDAWDVLFSWQCFQNPFVKADQTRSLFGKLCHGEVLAENRIRFFYGTQFYSALMTLGDLPILPRHLYDLTDPDNRIADEATHAELERLHGAGHEPTPEEIGAYVNENPHNTQWVGLGPYRITEWSTQYIQAERFDDYWDKGDPKYGGYLDRIRWRHIPEDNLAFEALVAGEIDFCTRLSSATYFGDATESAVFLRDNYKGFFYTGTYTYLGWNLERPQFKDPVVRKALAHAFDMQGFIDTQLEGLAQRVSGPPNFFSPAYDANVQAPAYDPQLAVELLEEAGWYDRDGDGVIDRDGMPLAFEFLCVVGNASYKAFGVRLQEALGELGIRVTVTTLEWATLLDHVLGRDFDSVILAWVPELETDPEQVWHSKWAAQSKSSNFISFADEETDRLIEAIQRELDPCLRQEYWHAYHRRINALQPYMFTYNTPRKFAMNKRFRGLKTSLIPPGYSVRQIYLPQGAEGTRPGP